MKCSAAFALTLNFNVLESDEVLTRTNDPVNSWSTRYALWQAAHAFTSDAT